MSRRRGMSLVEAVSAGACLVLVMAALCVVLLVGLRTQALQTGRAEGEQAAAVALALLTRELTECDAGSLRQDASPSGIVFLGPRGADGRTLVVDGALQWQDQICYYVDTVEGVSCLLRKEVALPSPLSSSRPQTITRGTAWFRDASLPRRAVAAGVTSLTCTAARPLQLTLVTSSTTLGQTDSMTLQTGVLSRN